MSKRPTRDEYELNLIRRMAYDTLLKFNCSSLPTQMHSIIQQERGVLNFYTYEDASKKYNIPITTLIGTYGENGFLGYDSENSVFHIFLNTKIGSKKLMKYVAVALSYIELFAKNHADKWYSLYDEAEDVYEFSTSLLAPNIILKECGFYDSSDIMDCTYLSLKDAIYKERQLKKDKLFSSVIESLSALENMMLEKYKKFIDEYKVDAQ